MESQERTASADTPATPMTADEPTVPRATPEPAAPTVSTAAGQELLCTICNLRACWEAPAAP